jgi:hypothetical protein
MTTTAMSNSNDQGDDNNDDAVEVFVLPGRRDSFKPMVLPPRTDSKTAAKKKWDLVKTMAKIHRRTSLTLKENRMLESLRSSKLSSLHLDAATLQEIAEEEEKGPNPLENTAKTRQDPSRSSTLHEIVEEEEKAPILLENTATRQDSSRSEARHRLRQSIAIHKKLLTGTEVEFLEGLADTPDAAPEDLERCTEVLDSDPLYQRQEEEKKTHTVAHRSSLLSEASYRKELWSHLQVEGKEASEQNLIFMTARNLSSGEQEKHGAELMETPPIEPNKNQKRSKWGSFVYKFQKAFNVDEDEDKDSVTVAEDDGFMDDDAPTFCVLAPSIPNLIRNPTVLSPPIMDALRAYLPFAVQQDNFWLKYSMVHDGASMRVLSHKVRNSARTILAIETDQGDVFGSFTSSPWRVRRNGYYGSGEAFLWRLKKSRFTPCATVKEQIQLESDVEVFEWSRDNRNIQTWSGMEGELSVGGGGYEDGTECPDKDFGSGISITGDLSRGVSEKCLTFNSPPLTTRKTNDGVFNITNIEVWTLTPVDALDVAEKLELGRQFIFDHGGFCDH